MCLPLNSSVEVLHRFTQRDFAGACFVLPNHPSCDFLQVEDTGSEVVIDGCHQTHNFLRDDGFESVESPEAVDILLVIGKFPSSSMISVCRVSSLIAS